MNIKLLLNQTVQVEAYTGKDSFTGEASYSPAATYPARIEYVPDRVLAHNGTEIPTYATVFVVLAFFTMFFVRHGDAKPVAADVVLDAVGGDD